LPFLPLTVKILLYNPFINTLSTLKSLALKKTPELNIHSWLGMGFIGLLGCKTKAKPVGKEN
jgi:hypothetical protein